MERARWIVPFAVLSGIGALAGQEAPRPAADTFQLGLVLKSARQYCARLEKAALDFICLEEVAESLDPARDRREPGVKTSPLDASNNNGTTSSGGFTARGTQGRPMSFDSRPAAKFDNTYIYDYQFVRRVGKVEEKRALLERNGRKAGPKTPEPRLMAFHFADILLAPVQMLDARFEEFYVYRLLGREKLGDDDAWVLEVEPRLTGVSRYLGGKIWLKVEDSSVLRIEWDPETFGNYETIQARAQAYNAAPEVRSWTEFGVVKNGLRFPSLDVTEEAYRDSDGKLFVRSRTGVLYRGHKFFTVETQADFQK
ncbi:MAG: hypothetical protein KA243_02900 [Candidatus Aminicenantes bacterium]|nr:hypothetical protein [Candidatus Aminicenantes bacterium]NLH77642.1 outer membrane lipoprotein-sorting protein [Acidobacteriota bacterium]